MTTTAVLGPGNPAYDSGAITLQPATPQSFVFDLRDSDGDISLMWTNTGGANAIDSQAIALANADEAALYKSQTTVNTALGSLAANGTSKYDKLNDRSRFVKLTLSSTSGTTVRITARGRRQ